MAELYVRQDNLEQLMAAEEAIAAEVLAGGVTASPEDAERLISAAEATHNECKAIAESLRKHYA